MLITKQIRIEMGHRVPNHKSKCKNLHGHSYLIEVGVNDKVIMTKGVSDEGMVIDFGDLKEVLMEQIDFRFDHGFVMYTGDTLAKYFKNYKDGLFMKIVFVDFVPTVENLAKYWYELLELVLKGRNIKIKFVKVWETPTSTALYEKN